MSFIFIQRHHKRKSGTIFYTTTLWVLPAFYRQASKSTTQLGKTQDSPKRRKRTFHNVQETSQRRRKWSTDSLFFLHIQHLSITVTCRFLRLFMVKIFPKATDEAKTTALKVELVRQILFQRKGKPSTRTKTLLKDLTLNNPFFEGVQQSLSSPSRL